MINNEEIKEYIDHLNSDDVEYVAGVGQVSVSIEDSVVAIPEPAYCIRTENPKAEPHKPFLKDLEIEGEWEWVQVPTTAQSKRRNARIMGLVISSLFLALLVAVLTFLL
jgi:hypothetical protein